MQVAMAMKTMNISLSEKEKEATKSNRPPQNKTR
ncbi:hypothetical protein JMJ77_0010647, partial [Colletotrichum scovillei]